MSEVAMTVRLFALARDLVGTDRLVLSVPEPATLGKVRTAIAERYPVLAPLAPRLLGAVNAAYASDDTVLSSGCEVALFPPVSGG